MRSTVHRDGEARQGARGFILKKMSFVVLRLPLFLSRVMPLDWTDPLLYY